ncbi:MAG: DUF192 domain-containing protein [Thermoplasmata archaeon]
MLVLIMIFWFAFFDRDIDSNEETIVLINSNDERIEMTVLIAESASQQKLGLMNHESLCKYCGMLFVYEEDVHHGFWMKNTKIALSIAFISKDGIIMEVQNMEPETTNTHKPEEPYRYALEVNQGFFQEESITPGDLVSIPARLRYN